ncbi:Acetyltransferase-like protein [Sarcoptes scabiei]|nr:Acetyltransferase-like protein [Sarcoptes scabiei]
MPNEIPNFITRAMNVYDNDDVLALCQESQIIIGDQINLTMMKIDHNCLHIAEDIDNGKVIGVCSGFNLNKKNAIFGEYAIAPRYRRFGIGNLLWKQCIEHCSNRNCAILATAKNVTKYREKSGFNVIPSRKLIQYVGYPQLFMLNKHHLECDFEWIDAQNLPDVIAYDEQVCGFNRAQFIQFSSHEPSSIAIMARNLHNGKCVGYGVFRRSNRLGTIIPQPLYSTSIDIAEVLIYNASHKFYGFDKLLMECWDINREAIELATIKLGLEPSKTSNIMFTEHDIGANFGNIICNSPSPFYPF